MYQHLLPTSRSDDDFWKSLACIVPVQELSCSGVGIYACSLVVLCSEVHSSNQTETERHSSRIRLLRRWQRHQKILLIRKDADEVKCLEDDGNGQTKIMGEDTLCERDAMRRSLSISIGFSRPHLQQCTHCADWRSARQKCCCSRC